MISVWHLVWIVPLSAVAGAFFIIGYLLVDECLWLADDRNDNTDWRETNDQK